MDIADQSNDKGLFCLVCRCVPLVLRSTTTVVLFTFFQRETAVRWVAETEDGCRTWVPTRPILTGGLDPVEILMIVITEKMMPLEKVRLSTSSLNLG